MSRKPEALLGCTTGFLCEGITEADSCKTLARCIIARTFPTTAHEAKSS